MALTITETAQHTMGHFRVAEIEVAFDSSYPTGGEALAASDIGLEEIRVFPGTIAAGYALAYDYANNKLKAYYGNNDGTSDSALVEVAASTDLSGLTGVRMLVYGL